MKLSANFQVSSDPGIKDVEPSKAFVTESLKSFTNDFKYKGFDKAVFPEFQFILDNGDRDCFSYTMAVYKDIDSEKVTGAVVIGGGEAVMKQCLEKAGSPLLPSKRQLEDEGLLGGKFPWDTLLRRETVEHWYHRAFRNHIQY
ncbi:hypothetical protein BKA70DRAFT_1226731 [Coprinopsis sp. MPI-PUGE-AT-0042]|nr:hypothetical protein BKA70DRAFT_1226731 [Coprinopsis sp. MPI-PUGE-AT-0042]